MCAWLGASEWMLNANERAPAGDDERQHVGDAGHEVLVDHHVPGRATAPGTGSGGRAAAVCTSVPAPVDGRRGAERGLEDLFSVLQGVLGAGLV